MNPVNVESKLALNRFVVDEGHPHITIEPEQLNAQTIQALIAACPASLYSLDERDRLIFDCAGCLECGSCRVICAADSRAMTWNHPRPTFGVFYRYG